MKRSILTAAMATLIIGTSAQAGSLTQQEIYSVFGEETYLSDRSTNRVDMASMEVLGSHSSTSGHTISLNAVYEIFGEERVEKSLPRADMGSMEIRGEHAPTSFGGSNAAYSILDIDV
ncbi:MAG: hypothetical protein DSZ28_09535 [Thiothrix sp.]|nr:MAG: hypothetical protein DSZ28_09535 [Thiothrix sp.]